VNDLQAMHDRHFVPYDRFVTGLSGSGADLNACAQDLVAKLGKRHVQAAFGFLLGWQGSVEKLDGAGGTHEDTAVLNVAKDCGSVTIDVRQTNAAIAGAGPGNVVKIAPTVTAFNPSQLSVSGKDLVETAAGGKGTRTIKTFSSAATAATALKVIQHYGMTSMNVIGALEYFLVGSKAPSGAAGTIAGITEKVLDPALYQVSFGLPGAGDWAITQVIGNNVQTVVNFGAKRNEAFSALDLMRQFGFTAMATIGAGPDMRYFRT
jgi:hypothetical protein